MNLENKNKVDFLVENKLIKVLEGESIKNGHNGPYYDYETPIRNISHWICTFEKYYNLTNDSRYYDAIKILSNNYDDDKVIKDGLPVLCRIKCGKDKTNGVMGQAWVIEGLLACARILNEKSYYEKAKKIFFAQRFDEKYGMWSVIECDGRDFGFDITFNHQLWFAAAGCQIIDFEYDEEIDRQIKIFFEKACDFFRVHKNGLIFHYVKYYSSISQRKWYKKTWKKTEEGLQHNTASLVYKEEGYHSFSVYAFALVYNRYKEERFFKLESVKRAIEFSFNEEELMRLDNANAKLDSSHIGKKNSPKLNAYAYPYNSPAFEFMLIDKVFGDNKHEELLNQLLEKQFLYTFDEETKILSKNNEDPETLTARIYELVRAF